MKDAEPERGGFFRLLRKLGIALVSLLALAVVAEVGVRVYASAKYPRMMVLDDRLGWRHAASLSKVFVNEDGEECLVVTNAYGHRGTEHPRERTPGRRRALVLGDSFTEGVQVGEEDLFTHLIEVSTPDLEVLNAGVGAYGTVQELLVLGDEGLAFEPDVVVLMVYANDRYDNAIPYSPGIGPRPHAVLEGKEVRVVEDYDSAGFLQFCLPVPFASFLARHSYLYFAFNDRVWSRVRADELVRLQEADEARLDPDELDRIFSELVLRMNGLLSPRGTRFGIVFIPTRGEVEAGSSPRIEHLLGFCEAAGLEAHSLLPAMFEAAATGGRPYFDVDIHWTREGHAVAAVEVGAFLEFLFEDERGG